MHIQRIAEPRIGTDSMRLQDISRRAESVFYPKDEVKRILQKEEAIEEILGCRCQECERRLKMNREEMKEIVHSILSATHPKVILVAILIYMNRIFLICPLAHRPGIHDEALAIEQDLLCAEEVHGTSRESRPSLFQSSGEREWFLDNYRSARMLFDLPVFRTGVSWTCNYPEDVRFPFLDDHKHGEGSFGEVYKFKIHPSYQVLNSVSTQNDWVENKKEAGDPDHDLYVVLLTSPQPIFARKVLRKKSTSRQDWSLEKSMLRMMSLQKHPNIIELLFVYEWRDQFIFVFPFVEQNLHEVLHRGWHPPTTLGHDRNDLESHWLWVQMVRVADALQTIHQPPKNAAYKDYKGLLIGFHFDLKPTNILVKNDGSLQITDFGQSLIKIVDQDSMTYGIHRGGSPIYQAPEARPTIAISESNDDGQIHRSYDIWSLACIMLEVLVFILDEGTSGLESFEKQRREEPLQGTFYTGGTETKLKPSVQRLLDRYIKGDYQYKADQDYVGRVIDLLGKMFSINQRNRPTSSDVYADLDRFSKGILGGMASTQQKELWLSKYPVPPGCMELGWCGPSKEVRSFLDA